MSVLVVGSVALDTVETPFGRVNDALGGSAVYFSTAASLFAPVQMVGVVGTDFPQTYLDDLARRRIDVEGVQRVDGKTFRWSGRYDFDLNTAHTLDTQLNVFADFHPVLPPAYTGAEFVLLANIDPDLQLEVLQQMRRPALTALDTMNFWISGKRDRLVEALRRVDLVLMNEAELRQFAETYSLKRAARSLLDLGPQAVIVKQGEYGSLLFTDGSYFVAPAYPLEEVKDPTGAGDSFAGGVMGWLAYQGETSMGALRRAIVYGSVVASFCVEAFSTERLSTVTPEEVAARYREFQEFTHFETVTSHESKVTSPTTCDPRLVTRDS